MISMQTVFQRWLQKDSNSYDCHVSFIIMSNCNKHNCFSTWGISWSLNNLPPITFHKHSAKKQIHRMKRMMRWANCQGIRYQDMQGTTAQQTYRKKQHYQMCAVLRLWIFEHSCPSPTRKRVLKELQFDHSIKHEYHAFSMETAS